MKGLLCLLTILSFGVLFGQNEPTSFFAKNFNGSFLSTSSDFETKNKIFWKKGVDFNQTTEISNIQVLLPYEYNMNNYPMSDLSKMDDIMIGFTYDQNFQIGTTKFESRYVFDIMGNLVDYQFSFPIGKSK